MKSVKRTCENCGCYCYVESKEDSFCNIDYNDVGIEDEACDSFYIARRIYENELAIIEKALELACDRHVNVEKQFKDYGLCSMGLTKGEWKERFIKEAKE